MLFNERGKEKRGIGEKKRERMGELLGIAEQKSY